MAELEKEAKESWQNDGTVSGASMPSKIYVAGYLASAEPREKRIEELEQQIEAMKCCENCKHYSASCCCNLPFDDCFELSAWELRK